MARIKVPITITKCPKCETEITNDTYGLYYGSPFRTCKNCNHQYFDDRYVELAISEPNNMDTKFINWIFLLGVPIGVVLMIIGYRIFAILAIVFSIFLIFHDMFTYKKRKAFIEQEKIASQQRFQNAEYVATLEKIGYIEKIKAKNNNDSKS